MKAIRMPIANCALCWSAGAPQGFTMPEWQRLKLIDTRAVDDTGRMLEVRACSHCGASIVVDVEAARDFDLFVPAEQYYEWFPDSPRVAEEVPKHVVAAKAGVSFVNFLRETLGWWKRRRA